MRNERVHNMKSSQQSITLILGTITLFIGIPVFLDTPVAGIIILLSPIAYHFSSKFLGVSSTLQRLENQQLV